MPSTSSAPATRTNSPEPIRPILPTAPTPSLAAPIPPSPSSPEPATPSHTKHPPVKPLSNSPAPVLHTPPALAQPFRIRQLVHPVLRVAFSIGLIAAPRMLGASPSIPASPWQFAVQVTMLVGVGCMGLESPLNPKENLTFLAFTAIFASLAVIRPPLPATLVPTVTPTTQDLWTRAAASAGATLLQVLLVASSITAFLLAAMIRNDLEDLGSLGWLANILYHKACAIHACKRFADWWNRRSCPSLPLVGKPLHRP
ncbi:hypothetical protein C8R44DRAFT_10376 [Mycena epipterygia]|nr:hypothetical protein C8R44DRAFT_10376 [Mycena epipterygia]